MYQFRCRTNRRTENAIRPVAKRFLLTVPTVRYYKGKAEDASLHSDTWGGARRFKFDEKTREEADRTLFRLLVLNRRPRPDAVYASQLTHLGFPVNRK
jgi:hypothetical protein